MEDKEIPLAPQPDNGLSGDEIRHIGESARAFIRAQPPESTVFGEVPYDPKVKMMLGIEKIPDDVGRRFDAHGIAKGGTADHIRALNQLLTLGIDPNRPFHSMPLKGAEAAAPAFGAGGPYEGSFMVLGAPDRPIREGIKYVIINEPFESSVPLLSQRFPRVEFISITSAPQTLQKLTLN